MAGFFDRLSEGFGGSDNLLAASNALLQAGAPSRTPVGFGQALGMAGQSVVDAKKKQQQEAMQKMLLDLQLQQHQLNAKKANREMANEDALAGLAKQFQTGGEAGIVADPTLDVSQQTPIGFKPSTGFDFGGYANAMASIDPMKALTMKSAMAKDKPKFGTAAAGSSIFDEATGKVVSTAAAQPEKEPENIRALKLIYGANTPAYLKAVQALGSKMTTHQPGTVVNAGINMPTQEKEQSKEYGKGVGEIRNSIMKAGYEAPQKLARVARMEELLANVDGGKLAPLGKEVASFAQSMGLKIDPNLGNKEAAAALAIEMALAMRQPGSGATSDRDFDNWLATTPDLSKSAEGRKQIIVTVRAKAARDQKIARMASEYASKNNGVIDDQFLDKVSQFQADNPVAGAKGSVDSLVDKYRSR